MLGWAAMKSLSRPMGPVLLVLFVLVAVALALHGLMLVDYGHDAAGHEDGAGLAVCLALLVTGALLIVRNHRGGQGAPHRPEPTVTMRPGQRQLVLSPLLLMTTVLRR